MKHKKDAYPAELQVFRQSSKHFLKYSDFNSVVRKSVSFFSQMFSILQLFSYIYIIYQKLKSILYIIYKSLPILALATVLRCCRFSRVQLIATLGTVAHQAPLSMGFSKNTGVDCHALLQGIFPSKPVSVISPALAGRFFTTSETWEALAIPH